MSVPAEVAGDIQPQVPGAADSLQHLSMQYILRLERVHGGCHPHDLAVSIYDLHILPLALADIIGRDARQVRMLVEIRTDKRSEKDKRAL